MLQFEGMLSATALGPPVSDKEHLPQLLASEAQVRAMFPCDVGAARQATLAAPHSAANEETDR
eukprot:10526219-Prorocentrum_lima.AAC.1